MNRFLAITLSLASVNAVAVCPGSITGKYSGSGQYTEQQFINNVSVISYIEYHVISVSISNGTMAVLKEYYAATGANRPAAEEPIGVTPFTFDKNTCTGQLGGNLDPLFFTVSDSGNKIHFIRGKIPKSTHLTAELWELQKQ